MQPFVIALDGPAASGKGTLAKNLARHYNLPHLDTGLTYRAVAQALLESGASLEDEALAAHYAQNLDFARLNKDTLSSDRIGQAASQIAVFPLVRHTLVEKQKHFAAHSFGAILDGRDIGTVVWPQAQVKFFIIADVKIRAQRRFEELQNKGIKVAYEDILAALEARDCRDKTRKEGPLRQATGAHLLDTTKFTIMEAFAAACALIDPIWENYRKYGGTRKN